MTHNRRSARRIEGPLAVALLLCFVAAWPLLASPGLIETRAGGDSPFLLARTQGLVEALRDGEFPVRWMGDAAYGLGYPFYNFYASLPYYLAALFKILGFTYVNAIKLTQLLGLLAAGLGAYHLSKRLWPNPWGAALASAAYTFAPFHLVNLYVRGDSLSEFWAFAFYPFILLTLMRLWEAPSLRRVPAAALAFGGLMMTHNVSALLFSPFVALFGLYLLLRTRDARARRVIFAVSAIVLGFAVSAWFWFPALTETGLVHLEVQTTGYFFYGEHFRAANLVQTSPLFDYRVDAKGTPFAMGLVQAVLAAIAVLWVLFSWVRKRRVDSAELWALAFLAVATLFITPLSRPLWERIPLLPFAQFPWRFLSVQAFAAALLIGRLADIRARRTWIAQAAILIGTLGTVVGIQPTYLHVSDADITPERLILYEAFTGNVGSTVRAEYLPQAASPRPYAGEALWSNAEPLPRAISGELASAQVVDRRTASQTWRVDVASSEARVAFQTLYYPGWRAFVDGREVACEAQPGWGVIAVSVPQGSHEIVLRFAHTKRRLAAELVSLAALLACVGFALFRPLRSVRPQRSWVTAAAIVLCLLLVPILGAATTALAPRYADNDLTMDWAAGPYLGHNPGGLRYESGRRLLSYELSATQLAPGGTLNVAMEWQAADGLRAEAALVGMAAPLFGVPDVIAVSSAPVTGNRSEHALALPPTLPPGAYLLRVRLLAGDSELSPLDENGRRIGQTYLQPITISGPARLPATATLNAPIGPDVILRGAAAEQTEPGRLAVALTWQALRQLPQNYAVSVRLLDSSGAALATHDSQPNYGFSPTSLWTPGEPVLDRHYLDLPPGLSTDEEYALQAVLYDPNTLAALGIATVPGVNLSIADVRDEYPILAPMGPGWALSALEVEKPEAWQGETVSVRATWAALAETTQAYMLRLQLRDAAGKAAWASQTLLNEKSVPANALLSRRYSVEIPLQASGGAYTLAFAILDASGQTVGEYVHPAPITIRERERTFSAPDMANRANADFGGEITLLGYDLQREASTLRLTLHWQAQTRPAADRKVFVHLFNPATEQIPAQSDSPPRNGAYPTSQWAPGEVVSDEIVIALKDVPAGAYRLAVGVYGPGDAPRLAVRGSDGALLPNERYVLDDALVVP